MQIKFEVFDPLEVMPETKKGFAWISVLILLSGENEFNEGVFSEDGFGWSYDETPIKDQVSLWSYLPKINPDK